MTADNRIEPANPVASEFAERLSKDDMRNSPGDGGSQIQTAERAMVDLVDAVARATASRTCRSPSCRSMPAPASLLFVRDLTLDNSLRLALVDSRRRYKDFIEISTDFAWDTGPGQPLLLRPRRAGALGYSADALMATDPASLVISEAVVAGEQSLPHHPPD